MITSKSLPEFHGRTPFMSCHPTFPIPLIHHLLSDTDWEALEFPINGTMYSFASFIQLTEELPMLHNHKAFKWVGLYNDIYQTQTPSQQFLDDLTDKF